MKDENTYTLTDEEVAQRDELLKKAKKIGTAELGDAKAKNYSILLLIRGGIEKVTIEQGIEYQLGRFDDGDSHQIDLSPHGAVDRGVSRHHASLIMDDAHLYIVDHGSTNNTFVEGERIPENEPTMLRSGTEIMLGRLSIQIMFQ